MAGRRDIRSTVIGTGVGALVVLALLLLTAVTGSLLVGIITTAVGSAVIIASGLTLMQFAERVSASKSLLGTRVQTLEQKSMKLIRRANGLDRRLERLEITGMSLRRDVRVLRRRVPAGFLQPLESDVAKMRAEAAALIGDLSTLREEIEPVSSSLADLQERFAVLEQEALALLRSTFESAIELGRDPRRIISDSQADTLFRDYLAHDEILQIKPLLDRPSLIGKQSLTTLRHLFRFYRGAGYWDVAARCAAQISEKSGRASDARALARTRREIAVFRNPTQVRPELPKGNAHDPAGPIVHMVGRVLPTMQTGYTLRTHYTALAQLHRGMRVAVVCQSGTAEAESGSIHYTYQGVDYFPLPGAARSELMLDDWLRQNILGLSQLVRHLRPSVLHAHSDFFNELIVNVVGRHYGIPTVYESRGFWEESWLSRVVTSHGWRDESDRLFAVYGAPTAYSLRKSAEAAARLLPNHLFTLAGVMRDYIISSSDGQIAGEDVSIVPNAVEVGRFPVQERDDSLAKEIGLPEGAIIVGYISSIVEYEGIDTLIDAFHLAKASTNQRMCLLLVGSGDHLPVLQRQVLRKRIDDVYFTGQIAHDEVLRYYGLIDVFVVPRKKCKVAELVTPLKPFEAFATGRAVVLSDVDALREIADQSGAAETFRAGHADDLAAKLVTLAADPGRRRELGERAVRWVRNHRSWESNVKKYYSVYKKLGYAGPVDLVVESELSLDEVGVNPEELLELLAAAELPPTSGWFTIQETIQSATSLLDVGWRFSGFDPVPVEKIDDWARYGAEHRSWGFHLHAWEFMDPLISAYDQTGEQRWLFAAVRIARRWVELHRDAAYEDDPMAWYDMSQALRAPRLIAIVLRAARVADLRDDAVVLADAVIWHLNELHKSRAFNPNNNHGFYTAVSQVHAAKYASALPQALEAAAEGRERLSKMADAQFSADGAHLEHSPDYHRMLLSSFEQAIKDELIEDQEVRGRVVRAAGALGWMIQPDGTLVQFGDSPATRVVRPGATSIDPHTQYILSDGAQGERPTEELAVFREGGYAFVRSPQPDSPGRLLESGYLAFSAAFHSRAHKHADDLNVVWFDLGQEILVDAGRFGYGDVLPADSPLRRDGFFYAAPERQYVEGTMAHNTLMIDGRDQERRTRAPYGSGIGDCVQRRGVFDLTGRVQHEEYVHRRRILYQPGQELLLRDSVYSHTADVHVGTLWFNISGDFKLESVDDVVSFCREGGDDAIRLVIESEGELIKPVRGQSSPMRGWRSRKDRTLEPVWSVGFRYEFDTRINIETRLKLSRSGRRVNDSQT